MGYFKSIHNLVFELLKLVDIYSMQSIASLIFNNILFANLNDNYYDVNGKNEIDYNQNSWNPQTNCSSN